MKRGFTRVARNVNKDGLVTGDWSEFIKLVELNLEKVHPTLTIYVANLSDRHLTVTVDCDEIRYLKHLRSNFNLELLTPPLPDTYRRKTAFKESV